MSHAFTYKTLSANTVRSIKKLNAYRPSWLKLPEPRTIRGRMLKRRLERLVPALVVMVLVGSLGEHLLLSGHATPPSTVLGQNYQICPTYNTNGTEQYTAASTQYLTSPYTYDAVTSGSQSYTVSQYQSLLSSGASLPPLPSYIANESSGTTAAVIYAPNASGIQVPAYDLPETPIIQFFEGGAYGNGNQKNDTTEPGIALQSVSGDEFIGGSTSNYPEPTFDNDNSSEAGIGAQNDTFGYNGGSSTLATTASVGSTSVSVASAIPGNINEVTINRTSYSVNWNSYQHGDTTIPLNASLTSSAATGTQVYANSQAPIAFLSANASQGATSVTLTASSLPLIDWSHVVIGSDSYEVTAISGTQSGGYTLTLSGGLDLAGDTNTPIYYSAPAGGVTVEYLDISHDLHTTTGTIDTGSGWVVEHNNIHDGYALQNGMPVPGQGVALDGNSGNITVEYNCFSRMGDYAFNIGGANDVIDYNEIYQTNYAQDPGCGCSGGGKWWGTLNADIIGNAFINDGPGGSSPIWLDNGNAGTDIEQNYFYMTYSSAVDDETGYNLNVSNNIFEDGGWQSGSGGGSNSDGAINLNTSGGFTIPGSRYENQMLVSDNQFINNWMGIDIWQSGSRSCENSGEEGPGAGTDASYCSGGYPNTSYTTAGGQYYFSHIGDSNHNGSTTLVQPATTGSTTVMVAGAEAIDDYIGFGNPLETTAASGVSVAVTSCTTTSTCTVNAVSTAGFPTSGQLRVGTSAAWNNGSGSYTGAILKYTGISGNSFTGVSLAQDAGSSLGTGTLGATMPLQEVQPYKVTAETCYTNDCALTISPGLSASDASSTVGTAVSNAGTCQLYATSSALPSGPLAPDGTSYWDGCQWEARDISVTGNNFVFDPSVIASADGQTLPGGATTTTCTAANTDSCGTNFMAFQTAGEAPFTSQIGANAMMSQPSLSGCPSWDSGCTTNPLANLNALANPPNAPSNNGETPYNDVWSNNTYGGPWAWNTYLYGDCSPTPSGLSASACGSINFAAWESDWEQDVNSVDNASTTPPPSTPNGVTATANSSTSVTVSWSPSTDSGGPGLGGYYVLRNGTQVGSVNAGTTSYTDTSASSNTQYSYTVEAYDTAEPPNVSAQSSAATVTTPGSNQNPSISLSLTNNSLIHGSTQSVTTTATPYAGNTISQVQLFVDGSTTPVQTLTAAPYTFSLNTTGYLDGSHTLTVKATDNQGNIGSSSIMTYVTNGDFTGANQVTIADLSILAQHWGQSGATYTEGNINGDGVVNIVDLTILAKNWGRTW